MQSGNMPFSGRRIVVATGTTGRMRACSTRI
uniref:Uncharacterized protein n=1 Tax=Siphoviridae sp. ctdHi7 TaxID=2825577 RepID=A0A8S5U1X9_9CAUD|nr:MAG TPA: hypothetical protein [Siphoviridae sp. ctdHi7]